MRFLVMAVAIGLPILDIASLIEVGERIGVLPTIGLVVLAVLAGSVLMRLQGFSILVQAQETLRAGRFPAREVFDGACVLVGSGLLVFPGFVSDVLGLLLLTPWVRSGIRAMIGAGIRRSGRFARWTIVTEGPPPRPAGGRGPVIDGDYEPVPDPAPARGPDRPADERAPRRLDSPWTARAPEVVRSDDP